MCKVSVVVPIYNVEKYIKQCVDSIRNQTLEDIEIILVDDGSPDNCPQICDDYKKLDNRIKVVHKKNGGLSSARNAGMRVATGEYIGFVDSDDYIEVDMYEKMYNTAKKYDVDFVMCDYYKVFEKEKYQNSLSLEKGLFNKKKIVDRLYNELIMREDLEYGPLLSVWNCLYKRDFIEKNNLYFDDIVKYCEDNLYSPIVGYNAQSFYYMKNQYLYNYRFNPNSISNTFKQEYWDIYVEMNNKLNNYFNNNQDFNFNRQLSLHMIYYTFNYINLLQHSELSFFCKYREAKKALHTNQVKQAFKNIKKINVNYKLKICICMFKYKLCITYMIIRKII